MKIKFVVGIFLSVFLINFVFAGYIASNIQYTENLMHTSFGESSSGFFNTDSCQDGQDFIIRVATEGCTPNVVTSDLLEEQDVAVFCPLQAIKVNPFIDVKAIGSVNFRGSYPQGVRTIGFTPVYASLGGGRQLNSLMWNNIGYVSVVLKGGTPESSLTNCEKSSFGGEVCWVEGNLSANIDYDLEGGFGIRTQNFYLPILDDKEYSRLYGQYEFFDNMGYLRAEEITSDSATIGVYSGLLERPYSGSSDSKQQYQEITLGVGEESNKILLPGLDCLSGVKFKLVELDNSDVRARITVNSETFELEEGEEFLNGKCKISDINQVGMNQDVRIVCIGDDRTEGFDLYVTPSVVLKIDGKEVEAKVGDKLYDSDEGSVYFAYADSEDDIIENMRIVLVELPKTDASLTNEEVEEFGTLSRMKDADAEGLIENLRSYAGVFSSLGQYLIDGTSTLFLDFQGNLVGSSGLSYDDAFGKKVSIARFGTAKNDRLSSAVQSDYNSAIDDFDEIYSSYSGEKYPEYTNLTLAENAFAQKINLANYLGQKADVDMWCKEFKERFSNSRADVSVCSNYKKLANQEVSTKDVVVSNEVKRISFEGVIYPKYSDYGAEVLIRMPNGAKVIIPMEKNRVYNLNESNGEYIKLVDLEDDYGVFEINVLNKSFSQGTKVFLSNKEFTIKKNEILTSGAYSFSVQKINLNKVAKVRIKPDVGYSGTTADFSFKIGIEKRAIQLSPEQAQSLANKLNDTIDKWTAVSDTLGNVVQGMKSACLATGAILTAKNLLFSGGLESAARQSVMRGEGGWDEWCRKEISKEGNPYNSLDDCLMKNSDEIDSDVRNFKAALEAQNSYIKSTEEVSKDGLLGGKVVDTDKFAKAFALKIDSALSAYGEIIKDGEKINVSAVKFALQNGWESGIFNIDNLKEADLYYRLLQVDSENEMYNDRFYTALKQIELNSQNWIGAKATEKALEASGVSGLKYSVFSPKDDKRAKGVYEGYINTGKKIGDIEPNSYVQGISFYGYQYLLTLRSIGGNEYVIEKVYDSFGKDSVLKEDSDKIVASYSSFKKYDKSTYKNTIQNAEVIYHETEPYKGLPNVVPVDEEEGWYAYIRMPVSGATTSVYDDSGRVNSFYLCNVGSNNLIDKMSGDDICQLVKMQLGVYDQFSGLTESEVKNLISKSVNAIYDASRAYSVGIKRVSILGKTYSVGIPNYDDSGLVCTDYMSPKDCKLLFNLCDPVICPNDRCDFGGEYPVNDVVQSGVVGSLVLCLPNAQEGIYVPVCLTGVRAGLDGWISVMTAYRDCLQENVETGRTVGICDEIHSIYLCEFFWKQAIPLAKIAIPKLISTLSGENVRGGSSYSKVESAWANAQDSLNFFTEYYAVNAFKAFKARNQEEVGTEVCKSFISIAYPSGQGVWDVLTEGDSPPQYNAKFEETQLTTVTSPPTSHYKTSYHIYAGKDSGAYYRVYMRGSSGTSYFQDTSSGKLIASGYIKVGEYKSESVDFTGPSGYTELCVRVNDQEECDFGSVTTSFAKDYLKDQYLKSQASQIDIKTENECVLGTSSLYSLVNSNIQSGVEDALNPNVATSGIIRTCASENPGIGTDPAVGTENSRWMDVGYCGSTSMRCWLDTESVDDAAIWEVTADDALDVVTKNYLDTYAAENSFFTEDQFADYVKNNLSSESDLRKRIVKITNTFEKVFLNAHRAYLYLLRGEAYSGLARAEHKTGACALREEFLKLLFREYSEESISFDVKDEYFNQAYEMVLADRCLLGVQDDEYGLSILHELPNYYQNQNLKKIEILTKLISLGGDVNLKNKEGVTPFMYAVSYESLEYVKVMVENGKANLGYSTSFCGDSILDCAKENKDVRVYDYILALLNGDVSVESPVESIVSSVFEYEDGKTDSNLCYKFYDSVWHWSPICEETEDINYRTDTGLPVSLSGESFEWYDVSVLRTDDNLEPTQENKDFITSLVGKSYIEGVGLLVQRTITESGSWISNPKLVIGGSVAELSSDGIVTIFFEETELYFVYKNSQWYYSMIPYSRDSSKWRILSDLTPQEDKRIVDYVADSLKWFNEIVTFGVFDSDIENVVTYTLDESDKYIIFTLGSMNELDGYVYLLGTKYDFDSESDVSSGETSGDVATTDVFDLESMKAQTPKLKFLMDAVQKRLNTKVVDAEACTIDDQGVVTCYTALMVVYEDANVGIDCVYSSKDGASFVVNDEEIFVGSKGPLYSDGTPVYVTASAKACINIELFEQKKLDLLMPGAQIDLIVETTKGLSPHSIMFVNWVDRENNKALVFDSGFFAGKTRIYSFSEVDLSDDSNPIYRIRYPTFYERVDVSKVEGSSTSDSSDSGSVANSKESLIKQLQDSGKIEKDLDDNDLKVLLSASKCEDCGSSGLCDNYECDAISSLIGRNCEFSRHWTGIGGSCKSAVIENSVSISCTNDLDCAKKLGLNVMSIAKQVKEDNSVIQDASIKAQLGIPSFECLVAMLSFQESSWRFCEKYQENGNPLYCEGDLSKILGENDKGIMQLNMGPYSGASSEKMLELTMFDRNVKRGAEMLIENYLKSPSPSENPKEYCGKSYYGWEAALRYYNGWSSSCSAGDVNYVENVLNRYDDVVKIFPECKKVVVSSSTQSQSYDFNVEYTFDSAISDLDSGVVVGEVLNKMYFYKLISQSEKEFLGNYDNENLRIWIETKKNLHSN